MKENMENLLKILMQANQLKRTTRTGWSQRGVPNPENVAAHSYGVAFTTMLLSRMLDQRFDLGRALTMALLHDLPEGLTTDIPTPAWQFLPAGSKFEAEAKAMEAIFEDVAIGSELTKVWEEFQSARTLEAKLVHDADKFDLYLQALVYEEQTGNRHLQEFWQVPAEFYFPEVQALYQSLERRRNHF
jgi:putative hydrolase of HD superfamily